MYDKFTEELEIRQRMRLVCDISRMLGHKIPEWKKAQSMALHFKTEELSRLMANVMRKNEGRKRLTLIVSNGKV